MYSVIIAQISQIFGSFAQFVKMFIIVTKVAK